MIITPIVSRGEAQSFDDDSGQTQMMRGESHFRAMNEVDLKRWNSIYFNGWIMLCWHNWFYRFQLICSRKADIGLELEMGDLNQMREMSDWPEAMAGGHTQFKWSLRWGGKKVFTTDHTRAGRVAQDWGGWRMVSPKLVNRGGVFRLMKVFSTD